MKILIINGYPRTAKGLHSFDDFHWSIKKVNISIIIKNQTVKIKFLNEQKEYIDIETEFVLREIDNIDDFLYEPYSGYARIENANIFDHIDMLMIMIM